MRALTIKEISEQAERATTTRGNRAIINRLFREKDQSKLYPIMGRFNVTERAIRQIQRFERESGDYFGGYEYAYMLECKIDWIVNNA